MAPKIEWKNALGVILFLSTTVSLGSTAYQVGVGRADVTGPAAEVTLMGYAKLGQFSCGIHLRQYARAFIFKDDNKRVVFVSIDACMMNHGVKEHVLKSLTDLYDNLYTMDNVVLSGTHTHSAPGGFLMDVMLDIPVLGFSTESFYALVNGIVLAIKRAHESLVEAQIFLNSGTVLDASINRSPASYQNNPKDEIGKNKYDTDKDLVQLKIVKTKDNTTIGAINWYAVHPTSMNNSNCLISSDNVGYASILLETSMDTTSLPGQTSFVGAFASTNLGDVSPNTKGPHCLNTGEPCDNVTSTCDGVAQQCVASGPGKDMFDSTQIIANKIFQKGLELLQDKDGTATEVTGDIRFIHQFVSMPDQKLTVQLENGSTINVRGCMPAMGYSFAAGTIDGVGAFNFTQGSTATNPFWNLVRDFIFPPSKDDIACHYPKPILIMSGAIALPYEWQPQVVSTQLLKIGNVILAAVPGEFTTMSGRRLRNAVQKAVVDNGGDTKTKVILAGLSNVYTNYIATPEEYQIQRYEGASTIYGPHTLTIYVEKYKALAEAIIKGQTVRSGPSPYSFPNPEEMYSFITPVVYDTSGWFNNFGDCSQQPPETVKAGDVVSAKFIAGHPRNNLMPEKTFLQVEKQVDEKWTVVATDSNWETKFIWTRKDGIMGTSEAEIIWTTSADTEPGTYRIRHLGSYKYMLGGVYNYEGVSRSFEVTKK